MLQAWPGAITEKHLITLADLEQFLQQVQGIAHRRRAWVRSKETALTPPRAPMKRQAWKNLIGADKDIGVALIVPQNDVLTWKVFLYLRIFQQ